MGWYMLTFAAGVVVGILWAYSPIFLYWGVALLVAWEKRKAAGETPCV